MKKLCARANSIRPAGRVPEDIILDKTKNGQPSHRKGVLMGASCTLPGEEV